MKRDDDYLRKLLLEFERQDDWRILDERNTDGPPSSEESKREHHIDLLCDNDYMVKLSSRAYRLTNQGHDYLQAIRDEGIWAETKRAVAETGGSATLEILKNLALGFLKKKISDHTGLAL